MVKISDVLVIRRAKKWERWNMSERSLFLEGYRIYGKQWVKVAKLIGTRDRIQVRSYYIKWIQRQSSKLIAGDKELTSQFPKTESTSALPKMFSNRETQTDIQIEQQDEFNLSPTDTRPVKVVYDRDQKRYSYIPVARVELSWRKFND